MQAVFDFPQTFQKKKNFEIMARYTSSASYAFGESDAPTTVLVPQSGWMTKNGVLYLFAAVIVSKIKFIFMHTPGPVIIMPDPIIILLQSGIFKSWKRRFFELDADGLLTYFDMSYEKDRKTAKGSLNMKACTGIRRTTACKWNLSDGTHPLSMRPRSLCSIP